VIFAAALTTLALGFYQHCGAGGDGGGFSNLGSSGTSPNGSPTVSLDTSSMVLPTSATAVTLNGNCNQGNFANYAFEVSYKVGSNSAVSRRYNSFCNSNRFSINVQFADVSIVPGTPGQITLSIIGMTSSGEILGPQAFMTVTWGGGTSGGTTGTTGTTGGTTSTTTGGTTSATTGGTTSTCTPSCNPGRSCGSTQDSCGGNTCSPGTSGCCTPTCDNGRACGSTQDTCGGNTCSAKRCPSCSGWQGSKRVSSMGDHREHSGMNTQADCQSDCQSYENVSCCQYDNNNKICYVVLSGDCSLQNASGEMSATGCN
jgi:hypothetical protein